MGCQGPMHWPAWAKLMETPLEKGPVLTLSVAWLLLLMALVVASTEEKRHGWRKEVENWIHHGTMELALHLYSIFYTRSCLWNFPFIRLNSGALCRQVPWKVVKSKDELETSMKVRCFGPPKGLISNRFATESRGFLLLGQTFEVQNPTSPFFCRCCCLLPPSPWMPSGSPRPRGWPFCSWPPGKKFTSGTCRKALFRDRPKGWRVRVRDFVGAGEHDHQSDHIRLLDQHCFRHVMAPSFTIESSHCVAGSRSLSPSWCCPT